MKGSTMDRTMEHTFSANSLPSAQPSQSLGYDPPEMRKVPKRIVAALDFGTATTSLGYMITSLDKHVLRAAAWEVCSVTNWPDARAMNAMKQLPSQSWYPPVPTSRDSQNEKLPKPSHYDSEDDDDARSSPLQPTNPHNFDDMMMDDSTQGNYLSGYSVSHEQFSGSSTRNPLTLVKNLKSKLLHSDYTTEDRASLQPIFVELLQRGLIRRFGSPLKGGLEPQPDPRDAQDPITDFLIPVFQHVKTYLEEKHGFSVEWKLRLVMTVPVPKLWSPQSSRVLQTSIETALRATKFAGTDNKNLEDLFVISEPEAAATYTVAATDCAMAAGEHFLVIDAGGGTTDATTYTVGSEYPLRLSREAVPPSGDNCGSAYLDHAFRDLMCQRLKDETYLFRHGETLETIVNRHVPAFEGVWKRRVDLSTGRADKFYIAGLRKNPEKWFVNNNLVMNNDHYSAIFESNLERNVSVARTQLERAAKEGIEVKKVFLVGGYGESPALRRRLRHYFKQVSKDLPYEIKMLTDRDNAGVAVHAGAVLRALDMDKGPERIALSSYGFLRTEPYQPLRVDKYGNRTGFEGHKAAKPWVDKVDGEKYIRTLNYFLKKDDRIPPRKQFGPFLTYHTFKAKSETLLCREEVYVCDNTRESHYTRSNPRNYGNQIVGAIEVDMTFLKTQEGLQPIWPDEGKSGVKHYKVEYELYAIVEGLKLSYEAKWPVGDEARTRESGQISIAAAFNPGTL